jgi:hypothetical protein
MEQKCKNFNGFESFVLIVELLTQMKHHSNMINFPTMHFPLCVKNCRDAHYPTIHVNNLLVELKLELKRISQRSQLFYCMIQDQKSSKPLVNKTKICNKATRH